MVIVFSLSEERAASLLAELGDWHRCRRQRLRTSGSVAHFPIEKTTLGNVVAIWLAFVFYNSRFDRWAVLGGVRGRQFRSLPADFGGSRGVRA